MSDQPTAPWWATLVAILLTAAVSVMGTMYALGSGPTAGVPAVPTVGSFFKDTITYIPHILLLFGILADMFTYQGVYSIPSLVGLISIPLNFVFKYFWVGVFDTIGKAGEILSKGPTAAAAPAEVNPFRATGGAAGDFFKEYDGCTVQGFAWAASPYAPQTLVVTATVFSYYVIDLIMNRGWLNATAAIVGFVVLFGAEMMVVGDCNVEGYEPMSKLWRGVMAFAEGLLFGGSAYAIVQATSPNSLPTSAIYPFPKKNAKDLTKNASGELVDDQGRPFVQLPNGQAVPDIASSDGQTAWSSLLASGTGSPATANTKCDAKK